MSNFVSDSIEVGGQELKKKKVVNWTYIVFFAGVFAYTHE
jgi:hypothetical protein